MKDLFKIFGVILAFIFGVKYLRKGKDASNTSKSTNEENED